MRAASVLVALLFVAGCAPGTVEGLPNANGYSDAAPDYVDDAGTFDDAGVLPPDGFDDSFIADGPEASELVAEEEPADAPVERPRGLVPFDGYRLPFRCGKTVRVSQGNNTEFSHQGRSRWAYDFAVARGTVIRAMAPGRVIDVHGSTGPGNPCYDGGGPECAAEANYVRIRHSDGKGERLLASEPDAGVARRPGGDGRPHR